MRVEYEIAQRLLLDVDFRGAFLRDRAAALAAAYPDYVDAGLFGSVRNRLGT